MNSWNITIVRAPDKTYPLGNFEFSMKKKCNWNELTFKGQRRDILFVFILNILLNGARDCPLSLVTPNFGVLTLSRLSSGFPQNRCGTGDPPPFHFLIVIQIYNIWYIFGKPLGFTLIICKIYNTNNSKFTKF